MQKNNMLKGRISSKIRRLQLLSACVAVMALAGCGSTKVDETSLVDTTPVVETPVIELPIEEPIVVERPELLLEDDEVPIVIETLSATANAISTTGLTTSSNNIANVSTASNVTLPAGYQEKFKDWYAANTDLRGWIRLAGTKIDYPVMQTTNDTYYLNRNAYKQSDVWGIPYMASYCTTDVSTNTILYGHSRDATGEQFSALKNYRYLDFYKANPVIEFDTVYADGDYKIIAFFIENTSESRTFFRYHEFVNQTSADYINNYVAQAKARSYINTTVDYLTTDKFLTISTCQDTNTSNYNRYVLFARKVRPGESSYVDTSGATQNANQILP